MSSITNIYTPDPTDSFIIGLQEFHVEDTTQAEPFENNIPRGEAIWNYGLSGYKIHTSESKQKISSYQTGRPKQPFTKEHKTNIKKARAKQVFTEETCRKISESNRGQKRPTDTCPHCGKTGGRAQMIQWHFDKCKEYMFA